MQEADATSVAATQATTAANTAATTAETSASVSEDDPAAALRKYNEDFQKANAAGAYGPAGEMNAKIGNFLTELATKSMEENKQ